MGHETSTERIFPGILRPRCSCGWSCPDTHTTQLGAARCEQMHRFDARKAEQAAAAQRETAGVQDALQAAAELLTRRYRDAGLSADWRADVPREGGPFRSATVYVGDTGQRTCRAAIRLSAERLPEE